MKLLITFLMIVTSISSIDKDFTQGKSKAEQISPDTENSINIKIKQLNTLVQDYLVLLKLDIKETPKDTIINFKSGYIEIISYNNTPRNKSFRSVALKVFHLNGKYLSNEITITDSNYVELYFSVDIVSDTAPLDDTKILITSNLHGNIKRIKLEDLENDIVFPNRITLKRDFYIPVLQHFIYILQLTREYNHKSEIKKESNLINDFRKSRRY